MSGRLKQVLLYLNISFFMLQNRPRLFIVHAANDLPSIKPHIIDVLEKEYEIPCLIAERDFPLGKPTITNVIDAIKTCFKTVVVITERSIKSSWVKYETLLALERSQRLNFLSLVVLLFNVDVEVSMVCTFCELKWN